MDDQQKQAIKQKNKGNVSSTALVAHEPKAAVYHGESPKLKADVNSSLSVELLKETLKVMKMITIHLKSWTN